MKRIDYPLQSNNFSDEMTEVQKLLAVQRQGVDDAVEQVDSVSQTVVTQEVSPPTQMNQQTERFYSVSDAIPKSTNRRSRGKKLVWLASMLVVLGGGSLLLFLYPGDGDVDENSSIGNESVLPVQTSFTLTTSEAFLPTTPGVVTDSFTDQAQTKTNTTTDTTIMDSTTTETSTTAVTATEKTTMLKDTLFQGSATGTTTTIAESETSVDGSETTIMSSSCDTSDQSSDPSNSPGTYHHSEKTGE